METFEEEHFTVAIFGALSLISDSLNARLLDAVVEVILPRHTEANLLQLR